jgi:predicted acetyltransferase
MTKSFQVNHIPATIADYPTIQNLGRFYIYELSRHCGIPYNAFKCPENGLIEFDDSIIYFTDDNHRAYFIKVDDELAGFIFLDLTGLIPGAEYFVSEFFIMAKFQGHGVGQKVAVQLFNEFKGKWALGVIPENVSALAFWRKVIPTYSKGNFREQFKSSEELKIPNNPQPYPMILFIFESI